MARMSSPAFQPVDRALYEERDLVRHHAMRRTLWVFTHEDLETCHAAATRRVAAADRKRNLKLLATRSELSDAVRWLAEAEAQVLKFLASTRRASTREIGDALPHLRVPIEMAPGKPYNATSSALSKVLLQLGFDGVIARDAPTGGWNTSQYQWTLIDNVTSVDLDQLHTDSARSRLAHRWLWTFGPAPLSDFQWWTGWPGGVTTKAIKECGAVRVAVETAPGVWSDAWSLPDHDSPADATPWVALLPGLDPTTMGWKSRDWYMDPTFAGLLFDRNGNGGPTVWVDGEIVGGWTQRPDGRIAYRLLADVSSDRVSQIDEAARDLERTLDERRFKARFPAPIQRELLS